MPATTQIKAEQIENEQIKSSIGEYVEKGTDIQVAYDIKILADGIEYDPEEIDENVQVTIQGIEKKDTQQFKIIHIDDSTNTIEEINDLQERENTLVFHASSFSTYVVLLEEANLFAASATALSAGADNWDGYSQEAFTFGDGTSSNPYLIATGAELNYLQIQVNSGNTYDNTYFQLANDINLNGKQWIPIGTTSNSFKGVFDGAGHIISNANIRINTLPSSEVLSYGIFGSIGNGTQDTIIRNLEIDSIQISIEASGTTVNNSTTKGYHIGTLIGTMYNKSKVINVIVKNSSIIDTNNITIRNYSFEFSVGGIVGCAKNTSSSNSDPGSQNRYAIENCFSNVEISLDVDRYEPWWGSITSDALFHTGGIIGTIRSQPVWPSNCLYIGEINTQGFTGPLFAALINNTSYTNRNNFAILWNGNDAGNLTTNNAYYSNYNVNGTSFTASVTSGTSNQRLSNSTSNIGYVQGVNKGQYINDFSSLLTMFNEYANGQYCTWIYENGTYSFNPRFRAYINDSNIPTYTVEVENMYSLRAIYI